jgi:hypothetical protein
VRYLLHIDGTFSIGLLRSARIAALQWIGFCIPFSICWKLDFLHRICISKPGPLKNARSCLKKFGPQKTAQRFAGNFFSIVHQFLIVSVAFEGAWVLIECPLGAYPVTSQGV